MSGENQGKKRKIDEMKKMDGAMLFSCFGQVGLAVPVNTALRPTSVIPASFGLTIIFTL